MIQFNLLPDIKMQYVRARRQKRLVILSSLLASGVAVAVLIILVGMVYGLQKKNLSDLNRDIKQDSAQLKSTPDLGKILTVQNQLNSLTALHNQKPVASRLFGYISQITPAQATISKLDADFTKNSVVINGNTDSLSTVNTFTDTLKFTTYTPQDGAAAKPAFSGVVLTSFGRDSKSATYTITATFDPGIFSEQTNPKLTVPNIISTRSAVDQPSAIFEQGGTKQ